MAKLFWQMDWMFLRDELISMGTRTISCLRDRVRSCLIISDDFFDDSKPSLRYSSISPRRSRRSFLKRYQEG